MKLTQNAIRRIDGQRIGLSWLDKIESVYSDEAMHMNWHTHDAIEIICCLTGIMSYEFYGKRNVTLKMSESLVIPPRCRHRLSSGVDAPSRRVSFLVNYTPSLQPESRLGVFTRSDLADIRRGLLNRRFRQTAFLRTCTRIPAAPRPLSTPGTAALASGSLRNPSTGERNHP